MARPATARQLEVLSIVAAGILRNGYPPTRREICAFNGYSSTNAASDHLYRLQQKGLVKLGEPGKYAASRAVWPTDAGWLAVNYLPPSPLAPRPSRISPPRVVHVHTGRRCSACGAMRFVFAKPCPMCAIGETARVA